MLIIITYYNKKRGCNCWINISPESVNKLTDDIKEMIFDVNMVDGYFKSTFYIKNDVAILVHISPKIERLTDYGNIVSCISKL